jgi:hypothetical protein
VNLYHGTNEDFLPQMVADKGIAPRGTRKGNWEHESLADRVYLTTAYPFYFAANTEGEGRLTVLEIDADRLDPVRFRPDEDFVTHCIFTGWKSREEMQKVHQRSVKEVDNYADYWKSSLDMLGNIAYLGKVPLTAVSRICFYDIKCRRLELTSFFMDPSISPRNYRFCGQQYRGLVEWMFGDRKKIPADQDRIRDDLKMMKDQGDTDNKLYLGLQQKLRMWEESSTSRAGIEVIRGSQLRKRFAATK